MWYDVLRRLHLRAQSSRYELAPGIPRQGVCRSDTSCSCQLKMVSARSCTPNAILASSFPALGKVSSGLKNDSSEERDSVAVTLIAGLVKARFTHHAQKTTLLIKRLRSSSGGAGGGRPGYD